jgi:hypothetical protein
LGDLNITVQRTISGTLRCDDDEPVTNAIVHVMTFRGGRVFAGAICCQSQYQRSRRVQDSGAAGAPVHRFAYQPMQIVTPGAAVRVALPVFLPKMDWDRESSVNASLAYRITAPRRPKFEKVPAAFSNSDPVRNTRITGEMA